MKVQVQLASSLSQAAVWGPLDSDYTGLAWVWRLFSFSCESREILHSFSCECTPAGIMKQLDRAKTGNLTQLSYESQNLSTTDTSLIYFIALRNG